jgi:hypothetical protein
MMDSDGTIDYLDEYDHFSSSEEARTQSVPSASISAPAQSSSAVECLSAHFSSSSEDTTSSSMEAGVFSAFDFRYLDSMSMTCLFQISIETPFLCCSVFHLAFQVHFQSKYNRIYKFLSTLKIPPLGAYHDYVLPWRVCPMVGPDLRSVVISVCTRRPAPTGLLSGVV